MALERQHPSVRNPISVGVVCVCRVNLPVRSCKVAEHEWYKVSEHMLELSQYLDEWTGERSLWLLDAFSP